MLRTEWTSVGPLRALVHVPDRPAVAGIVLVDGCSATSRADPPRADRGTARRAVSGVGPVRRADRLVPVPASVAGWLAAALRLDGLAVFPGADHGIFVADPEPGVDRTDQLAPGFLPMVGGFLRSVG